MEGSIAQTSARKPVDLNELHDAYYDKMSEKLDAVEQRNAVTSAISFGDEQLISASGSRSKNL